MARGSGNTTDVTVNPRTVGDELEAVELPPTEITWARAGDKTPVPEKLSYPANSLVVLAGLPGAGKTTLLERVRTDAVILNPEKVAAEAGVSVATPKATRLLIDKVDDLLEEGKSVILDVPALYPHLRNKYVMCGMFADGETSMIVIDATPEQALSGQARRRKAKRVLPSDIFNKYKELYNDFVRQLEEGDGGYYDSILVVDRDSVNSVQELSFA